jgi:hypothetical protein
MENGMKNRENQNGEMESNQLTPGLGLADQTKPVDESRRGFAKSGLALSGVILTLASRPVMACTCKSPSGFISGNVSTHGTPQTCSGRSPGYWQGKKTWPSPYTKGICTDEEHPSSNDPLDWKEGTPFMGTFNCNGYGAKYKSACLRTHKKKKCTNIEPLSLMQVLLLGGTIDRSQLGAHIVAALLNAAMGWTKDILTEAQVINIFNEWDQKGYFEPTAGVKWYAEDIVNYIASTFDD